MRRTSIFSDKSGVLWRLVLSQHNPMHVYNIDIDITNYKVFTYHFPH